MREHHHLEDAELERLWQRRAVAPPVSQNLFILFNPGTGVYAYSHADGLCHAMLTAQAPIC